VKKKRKITTHPVISTENISFRQIISVQPEFGALYAAKTASQIKNSFTTTATTTTTTTTSTATLYIQRRTSTTTSTTTATLFTTTSRTSPTKNIKFSRYQSTSTEMIENQSQQTTDFPKNVKESSKRRFELPTTTETSQPDFPEFQFMPTRCQFHQHFMRAIFWRQKIQS